MAWNLSPGFTLVNRDLARFAVTTVKGKPAIAVPPRMTKAVDKRWDFIAALLGAISHR